jgi:hypothetical protein
MDETNDEDAVITKYISAKRTYPFDHLPNYIIFHNPHRQRRIVSYGILAYAESTQRYLMVQRRYSPNYLTFLRGAYRRANINRLLSGMCAEEHRMIRRVIYRQVNVYDLLSIVCPSGDHDYYAMRFENHENDIRLCASSPRKPACHPTFSR